MDTCIHSLEYKADVCPEQLKYVREQANMSRFRLNSATGMQVDRNDYQLAEPIAALVRLRTLVWPQNPTDS